MPLFNPNFPFEWFTFFHEQMEASGHASPQDLYQALIAHLPMTVHSRVRDTIVSSRRLEEHGDPFLSVKTRLLAEYGRVKPATSPTSQDPLPVEPSGDAVSRLPLFPIAEGISPATAAPFTQARPRRLYAPPLQST